MSEELQNESDSRGLHDGGRPVHVSQVLPTCMPLLISALENLTVPASVGPFGPVCLCKCLCSVRKWFLLKCDNLFFLTYSLNWILQFYFKKCD